MNSNNNSFFLYYLQDWILTFFQSLNRRRKRLAPRIHFKLWERVITFQSFAEIIQDSTVKILNLKKKKDQKFHFYTITFIVYLQSTSAGNKIQLLFNFGESTAYVDRSWRIKVALLPCNANYLAPTSCLQYFTASTGNVKSFGWKDMTASSTQVNQLANQNYKICFRSELNSQNGQVPTTICLSECASTTGRAFSLSRNSIDDITSSAGGTGVAPEDMCAFDFVLLAGGYDAAGDTNDRFCGNRLNAYPGTAASTTICCKIFFSTF